MFDPKKTYCFFTRDQWHNARKDEPVKIETPDPVVIVHFPVNTNDEIADYDYVKDA